MKKPKGREHLVYSSEKSRGLNHFLDLAGVVWYRIGDEDEEAIYAFNKILELYGKYHTFYCETKWPGSTKEDNNV